MVNMQFKLVSFDSPKIESLMDRATRRALMRAGGFIRGVAKRSIRKRRGPSKPGNPPHSHIGTLKRFILYAYDPGSQTVVVGPKALGSAQAPQALEHGGSVRRKIHGHVRVFRIRRRPFMGPSLEVAAPKVEEFFRDAMEKV